MIWKWFQRHFLSLNFFRFVTKWKIHNSFQIFTFDMKMIPNAIFKYWIGLDVKKSRKLKLSRRNVFLNFERFFLFVRKWKVRNSSQIFKFYMKMISNAVFKYKIGLDVKKNKIIEIVPARLFLNFELFSFWKQIKSPKYLSNLHI